MSEKHVFKFNFRRRPECWTLNVDVECWTSEALITELRSHPNGMQSKCNRELEDTQLERKMRLVFTENTLIYRKGLSSPQFWGGYSLRFPGLSLSSYCLPIILRYSWEGRAIGSLVPESASEPFLFTRSAMLFWRRVRSDILFVGRGWHIFMAIGLWRCMGQTYSLLLTRLFKDRRFQ